MDWRWANFKPSEVLSPYGVALYEGRGVFPLRVEALDLLQGFREELGVPLLVNYQGMFLRGWRSPWDNFSIHGDYRFSFHIAGCAFDVTCPAIEEVKLARRAREFGWRGIGLYSTFVHMDLRDGPGAFWEG